MQYDLIAEEIRKRFGAVGEKFNVRPVWWRIEQKFLLVLKAFYVYLAFVGIFAFSLFIAQEATQIVIWSNFNGLGERRYHLVKDNLDFLEDINKTGRFINKWFMWINPVQRWSYDAFHRGTDQYITTIKASILANEPGLYVGEPVAFRFKYTSSSRLESGFWELGNRDVSILVANRPQGDIIDVAGIIQENAAGRLVIDTVADQGTPLPKSTGLIK